MLTEARCFDDAQQHAAALPYWNQVYDQLTAGRFQSSLERAHVGNLVLFREVLNQRVVQHGQTPADMLHVSIPLAMPNAGSLQGCPVNANSIMALHGNEEFVFHLPPNVDSIQVSITYEDLDTLAPQFAERLARTRNRQPVIPLREGHLAGIRATLPGAFEQVVQNPDLLEFTGTQKIIKHQFMSLLLELLNDVAPDERYNLTYATHSDIVKRSQAIVLASPDEPVTVLELCQKLRISRRTLQNSFQLIADTTPVDYLRSIRLNAVRRMLQSGSPECTSIREAAGYWGFYHLGHFSRDYRRLFDELPSETRARALVQ
ncbi:helix-turn-helix domain-containing protein [Pseudogulbenkiania ferrooxidans]|uniref:Transcriptional regulator, AraC family n=1 Tax=Pseudogulbenkiania ferrooxidans 2002 TaxID=279714 RepID=B9Z415_9NEIS|nr:helix-turn-helix domain-containing protein [Pseudogulbenkiania ferrooxidans]EEG08592.1 transcriptional regulator, AraC family [Pseudogulbenkiania ferrooxidans 2002]